jgi:D-ribose pyranose/furanose isomerase RbsD
VGSEEEERIAQIETDRVDIETKHVDVTTLPNGAPVPSAKSITRIALLKGLGTFLIGLAMICTAVIVWRLVDANAALREENACRFDISTEVNSIADHIDALTAEIFVEAIRNPSRPGEPNPEVVRLGQELDEQVRALHPAIEAREASTETCKRD